MFTKKKSMPKLSSGSYTTGKPLSWVALAGKYFSFIAVPDATSYTVSLTEQAGEDAYAATDLQHGAVAPQTQLFEIAENRAVADIDAGF